MKACLLGKDNKLEHCVPSCHSCFTTSCSISLSLSLSHLSSLSFFNSPWKVPRTTYSKFHQLSKSAGLILINQHCYGSVLLPATNRTPFSGLTKSSTFLQHYCAPMLSLIFFSFFFFSFPDIYEGIEMQNISPCYLRTEPINRFIFYFLFFAS